MRERLISAGGRWPASAGAYSANTEGLMIDPTYEREMRTRERNAAASVRGKVLRVLEHECVEMRLYLTRHADTNDDVRSALARLSHIEELAESLRADVSTTTQKNVEGV